MLRISYGYKQAYDSQYAMKVDSVIRYLNLFDWDLRSLYFRHRPEDVAYKAGLFGFHNINNTINSLLMSIDDIKAIQNIPPDTRYMRWAPYRFWRNDMSFTMCQNAYQRMADEISNFIPSGTHTYSLSSELGKEIIASVVMCTNEYKNVVEGADEIISLHFDAVNEILKNDFFFDYNEILDIVSDDFNYIKGRVAYLQNMLLKYSRNETTKLNLSLLLADTERTDMEEKLDRLLSRIVTHGLVPLQAMTKHSKANINKWLHESLRALGTLVPYFNNSHIEQAARDLNIWRYPVLRMDSQNILIYTYTQIETWVTWPRINSLLKMPEREDDAAVITQSLTSYGNSLSAEIYNLQSQLSNAKKEAIMALGDLLTDVQSFGQQSKIDKDFIMWVYQIYPWNMKTELFMTFFRPFVC